MDSADQIIEDTFEKYSEWLEMFDEKQVYNFMLNALAVQAVNEREKAELYKMALKRCEIGRRCA